MDALIAELRASIPKVFESRDYEKQKDALISSYEEHMQKRFEILEQEAEKINFSVEQTPGKVVLTPVKDGKPLSDEEFGKLPPEERKQIEEKSHSFEMKLDEALHESKMLERQAKEKIIELEKKITLAAVDPALSRLKEKYGKFPKVIRYFDDVLKDMEENHAFQKYVDYFKIFLTFPNDFPPVCPVCVIFEKIKR